MKVFYAVQISNTTKDTYGNFKWLLRNDACMNMAIGMISCILDKYSNVVFVIKVPKINDCLDVKNFYDMFENQYHTRIEFFEVSIPISPVTSRFSFEFNDFVHYFQNLKMLKDIDVMINDENTLTKNWNVLFNHLKLNIPIVSTNYFLDSPIAKKVPEKVRYYERQMESFINSDIASFQCDDSMREAMEAFDMMYKDRSLIKKTSVWRVGVHAKEILKYKSDVRNDIPTIYFGNRITDTANRYTNWHIFAAAIGNLSDSLIPEVDYRAIMLNPTRKVTDEQMYEITTKSKGKLTVISNKAEFTRQNYLECINKSHISCNLFVNEVHGGVTSCEAGIAGNILVMPNVNNYKYKIDIINETEEKYPFTFEVDENRQIDPKVLASIIELALKTVKDKQEFNKWSGICSKVCYEYESYEKAAERIYADLQYLKGLKNV